MDVPRCLVLVLLLTCFAGAAMAAEAPVAVSPGNASKLATVESRCPTFSWGAIPAAERYELLVYRLGEEGEEAQPVLVQDFAGSVYGWTPSLDRCLERGGEYAWSVRALSEDAASNWSAPSLFQVASGPTEAEFEEALAVVERYLEERDATKDLAAESQRGRADESLAQPGGDAASMTGVQEVSKPIPSGSGSESAIPAVPGTVSLATDGAVGIRTSTPLADLHVVGSPNTSVGLLLAGGSSFGEQDSEILLAETEEGTYGMRLKYDGVANELQIFGRQNSADVGPWLRITRSTGQILGDGTNLTGVVSDAELATHVGDASAHHDPGLQSYFLVTTPMQSGTIGGFSSTCPSGTRVLGGGCSCDTVSIERSYPSSTQWFCSCSTLGYDPDKKAYAICTTR